MRLIPAIDLLNGRCVRLRQGNYQEPQAYSESPIQVAQQLAQEGFQHLHLVDLEGARMGTIQQLGLVREICAATGLSVDFGGGIKSRKDLEQALQAGCHQVGIGSLAVWEPALVADWIQEFGPEKIILTADVRQEKVAVSGWTQGSSMQLMEHLEYFVQAGLVYCICTDIERDGMLQGPSLELYRSILDCFPQLRLIASGGVSTLEDLNALKVLGCEGVIFGKAYYEGLLTAQALQESGWIKAIKNVD